MEDVNKRAEKTILGQKWIFIMPNSKFQSSNKCQNPNPKKNAFDIEAFELDLTFGLCDLTFSLSPYPWKFNMTLILHLKCNFLKDIA